MINAGEWDLMGKLFKCSSNLVNHVFVISGYRGAQNACTDETGSTRPGSISNLIHTGMGKNVFRRQVYDPGNAVSTFGFGSTRTYCLQCPLERGHDSAGVALNGHESIMLIENH